MQNGNISILTIQVVANKFIVKYRTKENVDELLKHNQINVNINTPKEKLEGKNIKRIGSKTFQLTYKTTNAKKIVESINLNGCELIYTCKDRLYKSKVKKVDLSKISYNIFEKILKSKKYTKLCISIYEKLFLKVLGEERRNMLNKLELEENVQISTQTLNKYKTDKNFKRDSDYAMMFEQNELEDKTILYECFHGKNMSDSPYAIFKNLINNPEYKDYKHVWVLNNEEMCRPKYRLAPNVEIVKVGTPKYIYYLASSKYLINNTTFPPYYIRKDGQIYLNTWHGTPIKTLGKDMKGSRGQHKNIQRNFLQATHLLHPNKFTSDTIIDSHDIRGIYTGYVSEAGYPRIDSTLNCDKSLIKKELDIKEDKKVILYAPTWRGEVGDVNGEIEKFISDYECIKEEYAGEYEVLLRVHSLMVKALNEKGYNKCIVPEYIDTNELLGIVDLLITDYSSIMFDYLVTKKPLLLYCFDKEKYASERGFLFDIEEMPGCICRNIEEILDGINNIEELHKINQEKYELALNKYNYMDDGKATERVIDLLFKDDTSNVYQITNDKKKILMYCGGFLNNGITTSAINLLDNIDYDKYDVVVIDKGNYNDESEGNISNLNKNVKILYRVGNMLPLLSEVDTQARIFKNGLKTNIINETDMMYFYKREFKRLFSDIKFDIGIDFSGYVKFWTLLFACNDIERKVIYQHNEMMEEYKKVIDGKLKHKANLDVIFPLYNSFNAVVSVAEHTCNTNKEHLSYIVNNIEDKFKYVHNSINYKKVLKMKNEDTSVEIYGEKYFIKNDEFSNDGTIKMNLFKAPNSSEINFVNIGRMSPEKDQEKLIRAFYKVASNYENTKLYILGDGVLRSELEKVVAELNLVGKVIFTGQVNNPFSLIDKCNCFVLSSNHEGQPMVLLENLILNKDIIATDIPGNRSVLENGYGMLVDNCEEGLAKALEQYIVENKISKTKFNYKSYNEEAMAMFYSTVCGE